eukprot:GHVU01010011.1.p2 GENE.GHVU01010011.1~~GHVU01010011.1.p2  ORF type:complete len:127 (-),score=2.51 GHVU01010011.1:557-937(-)
MPLTHPYAQTLPHTYTDLRTHGGMRTHGYINAYRLMPQHRWSQPHARGKLTLGSTADPPSTSSFFPVTDAATAVDIYSSGIANELCVFVCRRETTMNGYSSPSVCVCCRGIVPFYPGEWLTDWLTD